MREDHREQAIEGAELIQNVEKIAQYSLSETRRARLKQIEIELAGIKLQFDTPEKMHSFMHTKVEEYRLKMKPLSNVSEESEEQIYENMVASPVDFVYRNNERQYELEQERVRLQRIDAKVRGLLQDNPKMNEDEAARIAAQELVDEKNRILFRDRIGFTDYVIENEDKEVVKEWRAQAEEIIKAIESGDGKRLQELMKGGNYDFDMPKILDTLNQEGMSEEDKTLLGIALWALREQGPWPGDIPVAIKAIKGGPRKASSVLGKTGTPCCIDSSALVESLTREFKIPGNIKRVGNRLSHRYWENTKGKVIDVWRGYERGGLFQNKEKYKSTSGKKPGGRYDHLCREIFQDSF